VQQSLLNWGILILSALCNALGVFIIKIGLNRQGAVYFSPLREVVFYFFRLLKSPLVISGGLLFFLAPFLFATALSRMDISVAQPAQVGLNFSILMLCAVFFLKEKFSFRKGFGVLLVLLAIFFLNLG